jgi:hypothetical protein
MTPLLVLMQGLQRVWPAQRKFVRYLGMAGQHQLGVARPTSPATPSESIVSRIVPKPAIG